MATETKAGGRSRAGMTIGAVLMCGPLVGLGGTAWGMRRAFGALGGQGVEDPQAVAENIHFMLAATTLGAGLFVAGVVVLGVSLFVYYRRPAPSVPPPLPGDNSPGWKD